MASLKRLTAAFPGLKLRLQSENLRFLVLLGVVLFQMQENQVHQGGQGQTVKNLLNATAVDLHYEKLHVTKFIRSPMQSDSTQSKGESNWTEVDSNGCTLGGFALGV